MYGTSVRVLVSPPGGGKSTYAAQRARERDLIVDIDAIVTMVHGGDYCLYKPALKPIYKLFELLMVQGALMSGQNVTIDRCNNRRETRMRWVSLAHQLGVTNIIAVVIANCTTKELLARRMKRPRGRTIAEWREVVSSRLKDMQPLAWRDEGFTQIEVVGTQANARELGILSANCCA